MQRSPQNTDDQNCFSMPCLFVLISHHLKPLTEIRTNEEQTEAEAAKNLRTMVFIKKMRIVNTLLTDTISQSTLREP